MRRPSLIFILIGFILAGCTVANQNTPSPTAPATQGPAPAGGEVSTATSPIRPTATTAPSATTEIVEKPTSTPTTPPTSQPESRGAWIAFVDADGNIRLLDQYSGETRLVTQDAAPINSGAGAQGPVVDYWDLKWSSDGELLAYRQELGAPSASGIDYEYNLWVYDLAMDQSRPLLEGQRVFDYVWKPGAHLLAYGLPIPMDYFLDRSAEQAVGIWALDVDSGESYALVEPQRGLALAGPRWAAGGRFLSFEEVLYMEGSGQFAYYDFQAQQYVAWEEIIGGYDWSPDGDIIAYDTLSYVPSGDERIYLQDRERVTEAQPLSPQYEDRYAYYPLFSSDGNSLAYLASRVTPEVNLAALVVIQIPDGEPQMLGEFENVQNLAWSPDGERLVFSAGPYENPALMQVSLAERSAQTLTPGRYPALQPAP